MNFVAVIFIFFQKTTQLKKMIQSPDVEFIMEAHNGLSAKIVQEAGKYLRFFVSQEYLKFYPEYLAFFSWRITRKQEKKALPSHFPSPSDTQVT